MCVIKSDFKDYYDVAQSLGQDRSVVYRRYKKIVETGGAREFADTFDVSTQFTFPTFGSCWAWDSRNNVLSVEQYTIGFCGKIYGVLNVKFRDESKFCYDTTDVDKFVLANFSRRDVENYRKKGYDRKNNCYFERIDKVKDKFENLFVNEHSPIFVAQSKYVEGNKFGHGKYITEITFNDCLKDYEFFRVFDPYTAYQEISMFFGNMAEPRKVIPEISNDDKIILGGHDLKTSFRKPKSEK